MTCAAIKYHMWRPIITFFHGVSLGKKTLGIYFIFIILGRKLVIAFLRLNKRTNLRHSVSQIIYLTYILSNTTAQFFKTPQGFLSMK